MKRHECFRIDHQVYRALSQIVIKSFTLKIVFHTAIKNIYDGRLTNKLTTWFVSVHSELILSRRYVFRYVQVSMNDTLTIGIIYWLSVRNRNLNNWSFLFSISWKLKLCDDYTYRKKYSERSSWQRVSRSSKSVRYPPTMLPIVAVCY